MRTIYDKKPKHKKYNKYTVPETTFKEDLLFFCIALIVIPTIFFIIVFIVKLVLSFI